MQTTSQPHRAASIGMFVLFALACLLYLGMFALLSDSSGGEPATRGLGTAFATMFGFALWIVLAILLALGAAGGAMPKWTTVAATILLPLSGIAAFVAANGPGNQPGWMILVPLLIPPPIALYAIWARLPALHRAMPPATTSAAAWGLVLLLSVVPLARAALESLPNAERDAKIAGEYKAFQEKMEREQREANEREQAKFATLNPDSPLRGYVEYLAPGDSLFREAVAGARQVKSRHEDAAALLKDGRILALQEMWRLDLAATPELCAAYGAALRTEAFKINKTRSDYIGVAMGLERQMPKYQMAGRRAMRSQPCPDIAGNECPRGLGLAAHGPVRRQRRRAESPAMTGRHCRAAPAAVVCGQALRDRLTRNLKSPTGRTSCAPSAGF